MTKITYPHLCAGVFFKLLVKYSKSGGTCDDHRHGIKDEVSQNNLAYQLTRIAIPSFPYPNQSTLQKHVSQLANCRESKPGSAVPYYDGRYADVLSNLFHTDYNALLFSWSAFLDWAIGLIKNQTNCELIAKALLEVIEQDGSFKGCNAGEHGEYITREYLLGNPTIHYQSFLLGIWQYICETAQDNKVDETLFDAWTAARIGKYDGHNVQIYIQKPEQTESTGFSESVKPKDNTEQSRAAETNTASASETPIEAEIIDEVPPSSGDKTTEQQPVHQEANIFNNYGNGPQIGTINGDLKITIN
ncbi:MAG: hypothetical protein PHS74_08000 [Lachnospiraceae bacterium]|nr:hypothetical protein [Lachnospiraceae bacterium]